MLKRIFLSMVIILLIIPISAEDTTAVDEEAFQFKEIIEVPHTPVRDQEYSGTCWSFATISMLESEALRKTEIDSIDLSEMYIARYAYEEKAEIYVKRHGQATFGQGGQAHDVIEQMKEYGLVPEQIYPGYKVDGEINHRELADVLQGFLDGLLDGRRITERWKSAYQGILDVYLGDNVQSFEYQNKEYKPKEFMSDYLQLNPDNYIEIVSLPNREKYQQMRLPVPDNWTFNDQYYNVPLKDMERITDYALENDYTVCWDADVSDEYFGYQDTCVAFVPLNEPEDDDKDLELPVEEKKITPEMRETAFNTFKTTDDHLMHLVGMAEDQRGNKFYKIKNSWGTETKYGGYYYISLPYFNLRTINLMVNKKALPKDIKKKLGIKTGWF